MKSGSKNRVGQIEDLAQVLARRARGAKKPLLFFISGTDTDVGKTTVTLELLRRLERSGLSCVGFKPIGCGDRKDAIGYYQLAQRKFDLDVINPVFLPKALAPAAQRCPKRTLLMKKIRGALKMLTKSGNQIVLIEGAGGLFCPIEKNFTMRELASSLGAELLIVAANRLGVLSQSLGVLEAARQSDLKCTALVLSQLSRAVDLSGSTNAQVLVKLTSIPIYVANYHA